MVTHSVRDGAAATDGSRRLTSACLVEEVRLDLIDEVLDSLTHRVSLASLRFLGGPDPMAPERDFLALTDFTPAELEGVLSLALAMKSGTDRRQPLTGKTLRLLVTARLVIVRTWSMTTWLSLPAKRTGTCDGYGRPAVVMGATTTVRM